MKTGYACVLVSACMHENLAICIWLGPPWFNYCFSFTLAYSRIFHEYSSLFIIVINLIFIFSLWCIDRAGSLYANRFFLCISVLRVASGPRVKLASCKGALIPPHPPPPTTTTPYLPVIYSADRSKVLVLHFVALWFILRGDLLMSFCSCVFQSF